MRVRLDVAATAGLWIAPVVALVIFGGAGGRQPAAAEPDPEPMVARNEPPPARAVSTVPRAPKRQPSRRAKPAPRPPAVYRAPSEPAADEGRGPEGDEHDSASLDAAQLLDQERYAEAILTAQGCLAKEPGNESCKNTLLKSYLKTDAYREATKTIDQCLEADPDDVLCLGHQMNLHLRRGHSDQAREVAERLLNLEPDGTWGRIANAVAQASESAGETAP